MKNPKINLPLILSRKSSNIVTQGVFYTSHNFRKFRPRNTWNASARLGIYRSKWTNSRGGPLWPVGPLRSKITLPFAKQICRIVNGRFDLAANLGRFPFNQNYRFKFSATCSGEWTAFPPIFKKFFPQVFFPFKVAPGSSRIFGWMVRTSENSKVSEISGNVSEKFLNHLPLFPNFGKVWLNDKRPLAQYNYVIPCMTGQLGTVESS